MGLGSFDIWGDKEVMEADIRRALDYRERDLGTRITRTGFMGTDCM